jgi:hypothetical protein
VIVVDEVAFLTTYLPDRQLRDKIRAALATLTTQGRAVGFAVVAALQPASHPGMWPLRGPRSLLAARYGSSRAFVRALLAA